MDQHTPTHHGSGARRRRGRRAGGVAAAAMLAVTALAPAAEAKAPAPHFQAILERAVKAPGTTFPGAALYVRGPGRRTWTGAAGKADIRSGRALRPGDRFRAGSIMKPFVAAATLQLVEEGRIGLDDPLPAVLPARAIARFPDADQGSACS